MKVGIKMRIKCRFHLLEDDNIIELDIIGLNFKIGDTIFIENSYLEIDDISTTVYFNNRILEYVVRNIYLSKNNNL